MYFPEIGRSTAGLKLESVSLAVQETVPDNPPPRVDVVLYHKRQRSRIFPPS